MIISETIQAVPIKFAVTWHDGRLMDAIIPLMLISMTLTLMQGHSGQTNQLCMLSATKQATSIKLATKVGHFYVTLTLTLQTYIIYSLTTLLMDHNQNFNHNLNSCLF